MESTLKQRVYEILEYSDPNNLLSLIDDWGVTALVILDVSSFILETSDTILLNFNLFWIDIELISVFCFTGLYTLQIWSCTADSRYSNPVWGRLKYAASPLALIDLLAILPFYLMQIFPSASWVNLLEILRLLRLLKLIRYSEGLQTILKVIAAKKDELLMTVFAGFIFLLIFAASLMFYAEREAQPEAFSSIPVAMWWGVVTLTTVGYGDIYPVTPLEKVFGAILAFIGIGLFALPTGIIASGFSLEIQRKTKIESHELEEISLSSASPWTPEQKELVSNHIEQSAELMKICIEAAKQKFGDSFQDEAIVRDLAITLYNEAVRKFGL